jgi:hypothetical protein
MLFLENKIAGLRHPQVDVKRSQMGRTQNKDVSFMCG